MHLNDFLCDKSLPPGVDNVAKKLLHLMFLCDVSKSLDQRRELTPDIQDPFLPPVGTHGICDNGFSEVHVVKGGKGRECGVFGVSAS